MYLIRTTGLYPVPGYEQYLVPDMFGYEVRVLTSYHPVRRATRCRAYPGKSGDWVPRYPNKSGVFCAFRRITFFNFFSMARR